MYICYAWRNLSTKVMDFGGFDSSRILILRGGTPKSITLVERLRQA